MVDHPIFRAAGFRENAVPLRVHGDGAQFQDRDSLTTVSMTGALGTSTTRSLTFYLASWPLAITAKRKHHHVDTWEVIWKKLAWSFNALASGRHPTHDSAPFGSPQAPRKMHLPNLCCFPCQKSKLRPPRVLRPCRPSLIYVLAVSLSTDLRVYKHVYAHAPCTNMCIHWILSTLVFSKRMVGLAWQKV